MTRLILPDFIAKGGDFGTHGLAKMITAVQRFGPSFPHQAPSAWDLGYRRRRDEHERKRPRRGSL